MNEAQIERFKKLLQELIAEGFGEVVFRVVVKGSKVDYISLSKSSTYKING